MKKIKTTKKIKRLNTNLIKAKRDTSILQELISLISVKKFKKNKLKEQSGAV